LRTACASISRSSALVFAGSRGIGFHEVMSSNMGMRQAELKPCAPTPQSPGSPAPKAGAAFYQAVRKVNVMSKRENDVNNIFRPSDSPLTEHEKEQIALRKNLERLKAERLAREAANAGHSPQTKRPPE